MPDNKTHLAALKKGKIIGVLWGALLFPISPLASFSAIALGYPFGFLIDPDLDQISVTGAEGRMLKIPVLGWLLFVYWQPYGILFRRLHRSFWTHSFIWSTIIRWIYQFWWVLLLKGEKGATVATMSLGVLWGLILTDAIHIILDRLNKRRKKSVRPENWFKS